MHLKTILATENKQTIYCSVDHHIIKELVPQIAEIKYEDYIENKSKFVFTLREISIKAKFTLTQNNIIKNATPLPHHENV